MPSDNQKPPEEFDGPVEFPVNGELDLHMFRPQDVKTVLLEYLQACHEKGIFTVRVVHGKGTGQLRQTVRKILEKHPLVVSFAAASEGMGSWGATMVALRKDS